MRLTCILDTCPIDQQFVNYLKCCRCKLNPLGEEELEIGCVECNHPGAEHKPNHERWESMKKCGAEVLAIRMTRG